jgi:hypothetical protein
MSTLAILVIETLYVPRKEKNTKRVDRLESSRLRLLTREQFEQSSLIDRLQSLIHFICTVLPSRNSGSVRADLCKNNNFNCALPQLI